MVSKSTNPILKEIMNDVARIPLTTSLKEKPQYDFNEVVKFIDPKNVGTASEHKFFFELCKARDLNPFTKEVYFIKYGTAQAAVVIGVDTFVARANEYPDYDGYQSGWIIEDGKDPKWSDFPFGKLLGAYCKVGRKDKELDTVVRIRFDAFNTGKSRWSIDPWGMIEKCAIAAAHRKAYPKTFSNLYSWEEMDQAKDGVADDTETKQRKPRKPKDVSPAPPPIEDKPPVKEEVPQVWDLARIGRELDEIILGPDGNAHYTVETYKRIQAFKDKNWDIWMQQFSNDEMQTIITTLKQLKEEFPSEVITELTAPKK